MFDSYKVVEKYPELKNEPEQIQVNVGKALHDLLERIINGAWMWETQAEINDYGNGTIEECNVSDFEDGYMLVLRRNEKHSASLKINYEELPESVKKDFEQKADNLLIKMKKNNFKFSIDIDEFLKGFWKLNQ